ncbi:uncharacterized protein LOC130738703 isoform X2 [Lotus japonicus]|uniref:uncharacterized protein LOC130738703 isoform X2 n=1 Tax=Lotus japonicus TaxID=34305 RepID=UPI0025861F45|nr:uncharacterized protein LOC130738703 isoform X2 [Lotus japonicus]XP_057446801.1 uncharacterized protein LOC130738703 isoform X2 [Lotus japonicus]
MQSVSAEFNRSCICMWPEKKDLKAAWTWILSAYSMDKQQICLQIEKTNAFKSAPCFFVSLLLSPLHVVAALSCEDCKLERVWSQLAHQKVVKISFFLLYNDGTHE